LSENVKLQGFSELDEKLHKLPILLQEDILKKAIVAGAKIYQDYARAKAPVGTVPHRNRKGQMEPPGTGRAAIVIRKVKANADASVRYAVGIFKKGYKTGLQVTNSMGGGVAFAAIAAAVGAARVAQIATTDSGNAASSMSGVSAGGYTYTNPETPTWGKDKTESGRTVNIYVYGNVIDHQQFARDIVPYLDSAEADGVH